MDKLINKLPELNYKFNPTTKGICKFNVYETLHTVMTNSPTQLLLDSGLYYDNLTGQCYTLSDYDIRRLLEILNQFINECLGWLARNGDVVNDHPLRRYMNPMFTLLVGALYGFMSGFGIAEGWYAITAVFIMTEFAYFIATIKYFKETLKETYKNGRRESKVSENRGGCV